MTEPRDTSVASPLPRRLGGFSAALFGLAYICPTSVISTFGILATATGGRTASAYVIATAAIVLTAISYARMAAHYPQAGSAYAYVLRTANPSAAFLIGWVLALDYFFVPMVICLFTAKALEVVLPAISYRVWVVVIAAATTVVNLLGIKIANRVNLTIMIAQLAVIAVLIVLCCLFLGSSAAVEYGAAATLAGGTMSSAISGTMGGAAIAAYSFLGFDAVTTLSEETRCPTRTIPAATLFAAVMSGAIFIVTSYLMTRVHPGTSFRDVDNAGYEIVALVSGRGFLPIFCIVMIAFVASVMCAQAGSSRLLYAMGRDGALPRLFSRVNRRFRTPDFNVALTGAVMLIGLVVDVDTAASCVNFGAFTAFAAVNACVIYDRVEGRRLPGGATKLLLAGAGTIASLWLLWNLQWTAIGVGAIWLSVGCAYLWVRRRRGPTQAPSGA